MVQSAINSAPSPQCTGIIPITALMGFTDSPPIATFYESRTTTTATEKWVQLKRMSNVNGLSKLNGDLQSFSQEALQKTRLQSRASSSKGKLPNFTEGEYVLIDREYFHAGEKLCLCFRGRRRIIKPINYYVYQVGISGMEILTNCIFHGLNATMTVH